MRKRNIFLLPIVGVLLFISLYIVATFYYPGGSDANVNAIGFSWEKNYWCNLLMNKAINGQKNPAQPIAFSGMIVLALTLSLFWFLFPHLAAFSPFKKTTLQVAGVLSMLTGLFIFTSSHDLLITIAGIFGLVAMIGTFTGLRKLGWKKLLMWGYFNLVLIIVNNLLYYCTSREILPIVQKITFALFLMWICAICLNAFKKLSRSQIAL